MRPPGSGRGDYALRGSCLALPGQLLTPTAFPFRPLLATLGTQTLATLAMLLICAQGGLVAVALGRQNAMLALPALATAIVTTLGSYAIACGAVAALAAIGAAALSSIRRNP